MESPSLSPPSFLTPDGWEPFELPAERSFGYGDAGDRLRVRYYYRGTALRATVWFGPGAEGPPGHAHGGAMAAVLDEALGLAAWAAGHPVVAARLVTDFRRMLPLGTVCTVQTVVEAVDGRKVRVSGRLIGEDETLYAEAEALLIDLTADTRSSLHALQNDGDSA